MRGRHLRTCQTEDARVPIQMTLLRCALQETAPRVLLHHTTRRLPNPYSRSTSPWRAAKIALRDEGFLTRNPSHLLAEKSILLCGEGDFSFARAMIGSADRDVIFETKSMRVTATSYEPVEEIEKVWGGAENLRALRSVEGVELLHNIDATGLDASFAGRKWDHICFMFPHIAGKGRISLNRELLAGFFRAATAVLAPGGAVEVALVAGQGGTPSDGDARREYGNTWQAAIQAAEGGLVLIDTAHFDAEAWESRGYRSRGHWRGLTRERSFQVRDGVVHLFRREGELGDAKCPAPVPHIRDISFWVDLERFEESTLLHVVSDSAGVGVDVTDVKTLEEHVHSDGRLSRTIRVTYSSTTLAYTRQCANVSQFALRDALEEGRVRGAILR